MRQSFAVVFSVLVTVVPLAAVVAGPVRYTETDAATLATMLEKKDFQLVNVHVPYQGEIEGTDGFIPYDRIEIERDKLPADKATKLVVYCASGRMSAIAARTLVKLGYSHVSDLRGGMAAWREAGYPIVRRKR